MSPAEICQTGGTTSWPRRIFRIVRGIAVMYLVVAIAMSTFQDRLIYFPMKASEPALAELARAEGMRPWVNAAGGTIGWRSVAGAHAANRLLVLHGNAGYALHRMHFVRGFQGLDDRALWAVYVLEYPGYGARGGSPGKRTISEALREAWETLQTEDARPVYVLGESIGSGPACLTPAFSPPPAGLCLVTPFFDLRAVAAHHFPWLPVKLLLRDQWNNASALGNYGGRVAVVLAGEDEVIPVVEGQRLYDSAREPKRLWVMEGAGHNTLDYSADSAIWREISAFLLGQ